MTSEQAYHQHRLIVMKAKRRESMRVVALTAIKFILYGSFWLYALRWLAWLEAM